MAESSFIRHVPCPKCGSRDNAGIYTDGHLYCHGCSHYEHGDGSTSTTHEPRRKVAGLLDPQAPTALGSRKIHQETAQHFGYFVTKARHPETKESAPCQVAPYYNRDGQLVAQKVRFADKSMIVTGDIKDALPFGAHAFPKRGKKIVVTEGEIDALSMSQVQNNKWPVVSISCGADRPEDDDGKPLSGKKIKQYFAKQKEYFDGFEEVVLMFDADPAGRFSAQCAAEVLGGKAKIAELPLKDANEMLVAGRAEDLIKAMWNALPYRPEGILELSSLRDSVMESPSFGLTTPWVGLDEMIYGMHGQEIITVIAGTGVGKTDLCYEIMERLITVHREKVAGFFLEATPAQAAKLIAGKHAKKRFHIPDAGWTQDELLAAFDAVSSQGNAFLYDARGANNWPAMKSKIEYLVHSEGVKWVFLDNMTSMVGEEDDERKEVDAIMRDMESTAITLGITIVLCVHANRPKDGKSHEEGGRVTVANIRMSGGIAMKSMVIIALERNQQADEEAVRFTTTVRCLKMRRDGSKVGNKFYLRFDKVTGMLIEVASPDEAAAAGFKDETNDNQPSDF